MSHVMWMSAVWSHVSRTALNLNDLCLLPRCVSFVTFQWKETYELWLRADMDTYIMDMYTYVNVCRCVVYMYTYHRDVYMYTAHRHMCNTHMYTCIHIHMSMYVDVLYTCIHTCNTHMYTCIQHIDICVTHTCIHAYIYICQCMSMCCIHVYICVTHICIHVYNTSTYV